MSVFPSTQATHFLVKVTPLQNKFNQYPKVPTFSLSNHFQFSIKLQRNFTARTPDCPLDSKLHQRNPLDQDHPMTLALRNRIEYPAIPIRDDDVFIRGIFGETFMNLAHKFYNDKDFWWVIARANNQGSSIYTVPGKEYRIPQNLNLILQEFQELNS